MSTPDWRTSRTWRPGSNRNPSSAASSATTGRSRTNAAAGSAARRVCTAGAPPCPRARRPRPRARPRQPAAPALARSPGGVGGSSYAPVRASHRSAPSAPAPTAAVHGKPVERAQTDGGARGAPGDHGEQTHPSAQRAEHGHGLRQRDGPVRVVDDRGERAVVVEGHQGLVGVLTAGARRVLHLRDLHLRDLREAGIGVHRGHDTPAPQPPAGLSRDRSW